MKFLRSMGLFISYDMWNTTVVQTALILIFSPIIAAIMWTPVQSVSYTYVLTFLWASISLWILWLFRKKRSLPLASSLYVVNAVVCGLGVAFNQETWLASHVPFQAFFGFKFMACIIAMQAPPDRRVGWSCLIFFVMAPLLQHLWWSSGQREEVGIHEPWLTVVTVGCAAVLYEQSLQFRQMLEKKARLEISTQEMRRYAHLLLGAQHLINTPLQIIEGTSELIRHHHPEAGGLIERIEKAFGPIKEVNRLLSFGRNHVDWLEVQLPSTVADLEKEICVLIPELEDLQRKSETPQ